ncbi:MAG: ECF transporter S component [Syntrophomonadaceae bacterium]
MSIGLFRRLSVYDLIIIAMMAAVGVATKVIIVPLIHIITGPFFIPSGAVAGGFYMLWLVLGFGITGKRGTMTLIGLVQAILVIASGIVGSHGVLSLLTYTVPGILADLGLFLIGHRVCCLPCSFLAGMFCNIGGTVMVNFIYFRLPIIPLAFSLGIAALSGGLGGIIAYKILQQVREIKNSDQSVSKVCDQ